MHSERLVFVNADARGHDQLFTINVNGSGLRQLTFGGYSNNSPSFAPDGQRLAYLHRDRVLTHNVLMIADQHATHGVALGPTDVSGYSWSPSGRYIAYNAGGIMYVMPSRGGRRRLVLDTKGDTLGGPVWSPDGRYLGFGYLDYCDMCGSQWATAVMRPWGGRRVMIDDLGGSTTWSADGRYLLSTHVNEKTGWIWGFDPASGSPVVLHRLVVPAGVNPIATSRDGRWLALNGRPGLWLAHTDGSSPRRLVAGDHPAAFSPDSKWLAVVRTWKYGRSGLAVISVDGGPMRDLARGPRAGGAVFQPWRAT